MRRSIPRSMERASRRKAQTRSPAPSAIRRARSTICSPSTSCSARRCRTSHSTPSPISATPTAGSCEAVYPGDTLSSVSEVIGLKENSNRQTGVVYVRSRGLNQRGRGRRRICALGDGAEARRRQPGARSCRSETAGGGRRLRPRRGLSADRPGRLRRRARRVAASDSRTTRPASASTTSTASRSKRPST